MSLFGPLDPMLALLVAAYRFRRLRPWLLVLGFIPALLYSLPAQSCGCMFMPFVRCLPRTNMYFAAMKSDLKNLASQQEIYFSDNDSYSASFERLGFFSSDGVQVRVRATANGWSAWATHLALEEAEGCGMYYGDAPLAAKGPPIEGAPGELVCTN